MLDHRHVRSALIFAIASVQTTALAMAEMPLKTDVSAFPKILNELVISSDQDSAAVFQLSQSWGKLLKGSRLIGKPHLNNDELNICIQQIFFADRQQESAEAGQCLARAAPAPDAVILRKANGVLVVPEAQPFYLYDLPAAWESDHQQR